PRLRRAGAHSRGLGTRTRRAPRRGCIPVCVCGWHRRSPRGHTTRGAEGTGEWRATPQPANAAGRTVWRRGPSPHGQLDDAAPIATARTNRSLPSDGLTDGTNLPFSSIVPLSLTTLTPIHVS